VIRLLHFRRRWLVAILLPVLVLRALVPAGFMATAASDGGVHMQFCVHAGMHASHAPGSNQAADPRCPFAQSASPAPLPVLSVAAPDVLHTPVVQPDPLVRTFNALGSYREQTPRGPPTLA